MAGYSRFGLIARALRLPFMTASVLPFIYGSLLSEYRFRPVGFVLGLSAVICTHLYANLLNDYADSRSGLDWQDTRWFVFFGGSKVIQQGLLPERWFRTVARGFGIAAGLCAAALAFVLRSPQVAGYFLAIGFLARAYSAPPFKLSYRGMGEAAIFILFGPALVMGGFFIQTGVFPSIKSFLLSLPFGFLTTAILFVNEIPDFPQDSKAGKTTWVSISGQSQSFIVYYALIGLAYLYILFNGLLGNAGAFSMSALGMIPLAWQAGRIVKRHYQDKRLCMRASQMTIIIQTATSVVLLIDAWWKWRR